MSTLIADLVYTFSSDASEKDIIVTLADRLKVLRDRSTAPLRQDKREILSIIARLDQARVTMEVLRETGIGVEINRPYIRQHVQQVVRDQSTALTAKWKAMVRGKPVEAPETKATATLVRTLHPTVSDCVEPVVSDSLSNSDAACASQNADDEACTTLALLEPQKPEDVGIIPAAEYLQKQKDKIARFVRRLERQEVREEKERKKDERRKRAQRKEERKRRERRHESKLSKKKVDKKDGVTIIKSEAKYLQRKLEKRKSSEIASICVRPDVYK